MTCIVGIENKGKVYMGADSAASTETHIDIREDKKIFKVGEFLIGCTTSYRMIQILQFSFKPPKNKGKDSFEYMCTDFIDEVREVFKDKGFGGIDDDGEIGGNFLVGYKGQLFEIGDDFQVMKTLESFNSIGGGMSYALGALMAMPEGMKPKDKIKRALFIASHFSEGIRPPFHILKT